MADAESPHRLLLRILTRPQSYLVGTFGGLVVLGSILLALPVAHHQEELSYLDALFTATSAVCVTGLVVVDTGKDFTVFGQIVILTLIQLGGLGIMTFAALVMQLVGHRLSLRTQMVLYDVFYQRSAARSLRRRLGWIVAFTLMIEATGAALFMAMLPEEIGPWSRAYVAVFHAISAFCNAGFSLFTDSLIGLDDNVGFMTVISVLIVIGGVGYMVVFEMIGRGWRRLGPEPMRHAWSLNTRVVLASSGILIVVGAVALDLLGTSSHADSVAGRMGHGVFQSITARTAGFNTIEIAVLPTCSLLWLVLLMFVGGSPGSCAGGVKTTTLAVWAARLWARLRNQEDVTIGGRRIPPELVRRTGLLLGVAAVYNLTGVMLLSITELDRGVWTLRDVVFEQISAFATVGLSTGLTPDLTTVGKLWIIVTMFVGRLGPLTLAMVVLDRRASLVRMPEERLMIG